MNLEEWKNLASAAQSLMTALSLLVGGLWVLWNYVLRQERYPNVEFSADLNFVGKQHTWWIVEIVALVENKGKVQHRMTDFKFDLNALNTGDSIETSEKWGNQVDFGRAIAAGSFLPSRYQSFFIDPGVKAKYSYVVRVPTTARFLLLHCWFKYSDRRKFGHTAEKTVAVPY